MFAVLWKCLRRKAEDMGKPWPNTNNYASLVSRIEGMHHKEERHQLRRGALKVHRYATSCCFGMLGIDLHLGGLRNLLTSQQEVKVRVVTLR